MSDLRDNWPADSVNSDTSTREDRWQSQSFAATGAYTIDVISYYGRRITGGGSIGTCYIEIFATDPLDDGKPTGSALVSQDFDGDLIDTSSDAWHDITLDTPLSLTRATTYTIILRAPNSPGSAEWLDWRVDALSDYTSGENFSTTNGGASYSRAGSDSTLPFRVYGASDTPTLLAEILFEDDATSGSSVTTSSWYAQTISASVDITLMGVDLSMYATSDSAGTISIEVYPTDAEDKPVTSGSALGSATYNRPDFAPLSDRPNPWIGVNFDSPVALQANTHYAIVVRSSTSSASYWKNASISGTYPGGRSWRTSDSGATWVVLGSNGDMAIKSYVFSAAGVTPEDLDYSKKLVAVGNNQLWYEATPGTMSELADATDDIDCGELLNLFEGYGKVFVTNKDNLKIADFQNSKITTANVGAVYPQFGALLAGGTSNAGMVVDYITTLSGACTIYGTTVTEETFTSGEAISGVNPDGTSVSFTTNSAEDTGPHWYNWTTYGNSTNFGALPPSATLGCLFRGRAVIAGNTLAPHQWYMSRQANPFDWIYGINDAQSAVAGNNTDAGEVGDVVTALIPYKDDFLIFGCVDSIWYLTGDPTSGGSLDELDLTTGIFGANSWCWGDQGDLYFWGLNGIYKVALPGGVPMCISEIRLPGLIDDEAAGPDTHRITMSYDKRRAGILTSITKLSDGSNSCYWYDFRTNGFFPESYPNACGAYSSILYNAIDANFKQVMYGCADGYIRYHDDAAKDDGVTSGAQAIESYVTFGPFLMSSSAINEGKITGFDLILGGGGSSPESDGAQYELYTGTSAQEVVKRMAAGSPIAAAGGTSISGRQRKTFKRKVRGVYCGIKVKNITLAQTWAMEQALITIAKAGRLR
jgi:hypothetical protein